MPEGGLQFDNPLQDEWLLPFRVLNEIGIIAQLSQTAFERVMPAGMTLSQFTVLNHFVRLGGIRSPAELASAFQVTRATMTSTLQKLAAKQLVTVSPDVRDGRGKCVAITPNGVAMQAACIAAVLPEMQRMGLGGMGLGGMGTALAALLPGLGQLRHKLDQARGPKPLTGSGAADDMG